VALSDPAARRYADAVFGIAHDTASHDRWLADLDDIADLFGEPTVYGFLVSTRVPQAEKEQVLDNALPDLQTVARNFAKLLVRKQRANLAPQIIEAFRERLNSVRGIAEATVTTAVPLSDDARAAVEEAVKRYTNVETVSLSETVDDAIIGGAVVKIGDRIIDGSVRTRLSTMRRSLAQG
jgi:F-type H+-transporting ATPase subunit delta